MSNLSISKNEELNEYAQLLLDNGFTIIAPKEPSTYYHFEKDNKIGYCQYDRLRGVTFTSVHKPCRECGTGFGLEDDRNNQLLSLSVDSALATINCFAPGWASMTDLKAVVKYKDIAEFTNDWFRKDSRIINPSNL
jgi:hypothetical protein